MQTFALDKLIACRESGDTGIGGHITGCCAVCQETGIVSPDSPDSRPNRQSGSGSVLATQIMVWTPVGDDDAGEVVGDAGDPDPLGDPSFLLPMHDLRERDKHRQCSTNHQGIADVCGEP